MADVLDQPDVKLKTEFHALVAEWKAARGHLSSVNAWVKLPAYRAIVAFGFSAVPLLLAELEGAPDHWFWALSEITGEKPVPPENRGNVIKMAECWIRWGKAKGYRW